MKNTVSSRLTAEFAEQICAFRFEDIPVTVSNVAKHCLLDWLGVAIAGAGEPSISIIVDQIQTVGSRGCATLIARSTRTSLLEAALANGAAGHTLDLDDVNEAFGGHPSAPILPALLAVSEVQRVSGPDLLVALVAGTETECAIAAAIGQGMRDRGFHSTAVNGALGAATAVGQLIGLNRAQMVNTIGIAACHAAGMGIAFGTMVKALQVGNAAMNGLRAALLAQRGFSAPQEVFLHRRGFASLFGVEELQEKPHINGYFTLETLFKNYPCCFALHGVIDAAIEIRKSPFYDSALVNTVEVFVHPSMPNLCSLKVPINAQEAKFSLPYALALVLTDGDPTSLNSWIPSVSQTPQMLRLMQHVHVTVATPPTGESCKVRIAQSNKFELNITSPLREPSSDLSAQWSDLALKFNRYAAPIIGEKRADQLINAVDSVEDLDDVSKLLELTIPSGGT